MSMIDKVDQKRIQEAGIYFVVSTIITWFFIDFSPLYVDVWQKLLSCSIAGAKWTVQIVAAIILLQGRKWIFIRHISYTCLIGSLLLVPYTISSMVGGANGTLFFMSSLMLSVVTMIALYLRSVKRSGVPTLWWTGWLFCLALAIMGQLKVVFNLTILD